MWIVYNTEGVVLLKTTPTENKQSFLNAFAEANGIDAANLSVLAVEDPQTIRKVYDYEVSITEGEIVFGKLIEQEPQPLTEIELLQQENLVLQLALAETIEKQETDKINNQIALAELVETLTLQGVL